MTSSSFKKYNDKKSQEILQLEKELISSKKWDMKGEVKGQERPENSLLSISSIIERASKPIPIVSQEHTNTIEDLIINRIKNDNYNDVIPYKKPLNNNDNNNDNDDSINEKSKIGLGQIYENEYIEKNNSNSKSSNSDKLDANKEEIKELFNIINKQLDALSHFHYTPKPVVNDINITSIKNSSSIRSILIENINPTSESDANALAPEDVYKKKTGRSAALKADVEYDRDDKKRLRQASKSKKRKEKKQKTIDDTMKAKANINSKEARKLDEKQVDDIIRTDKRVTQGKNSDSTSYSNSTTFFTKVQNLKDAK